MDMTLDQAWWASRQGLDGSLNGKSAADILTQTGWSRSVGGVGPYLTLFARGGLSRQDTDRAVESLQIHELPSARGCTYVVPARHFGLAVSAAREFGGSEMRTAEKLGVTGKEIDTLCTKVLDALRSGPKDPEELRASVGSAVRNLGEAGKKKGLITTLPVALGRLQIEGEIRRIPVNGRLDQQRYRYTLWKPNPLAGVKLTPQEVHVEIARLYFRWIAPATLAEFKEFSALGVKASKEAVEPLGLVSVPEGDGRLMFPDDLEAYRSFKPPKKAAIVLVSGLDGLALFRRNIGSLIDPKDAKRKVLVDATREMLGGLSDLPSHGIFDRGRLIGLWEYDMDRESIAWMSFVPKTKEILAAVERTESFVRDQLGDARSFSLDSPKSRAPRIEALRKAG